MLKPILFLFLVTGSLSCMAQLFTGGATNISYDNGLVIDVAPEIGYKMDKIRVGASPFILYKEITDNENISAGARVFTQYDLTKEIFAHAECMATRIQTTTSLLTGDVKTAKWIVSFPIGGGYRYKIADGTYAWGSILYDFFLTADSPQKNPLIRGGITYEF